MNKVVIKEFDDSLKPFIEKVMVKYGDEYNKADFDTYFSSEHINIGAFLGEELIAFVCLLNIDDKFYVAYTYQNGSYKAKRVYIQGYKYLKDRYKNKVVLDAEQYPKHLTRKGKLWAEQYQ